jgi:hypothetical protein
VADVDAAGPFYGVETDLTDGETRLPVDEAVRR